MMSFMGSIGSIMKEAGLEETLGTVYGLNAFTHMIRNAVSRALHGYFLVQAALFNKLMSAATMSRSSDGEGEENDCEANEDLIVFVIHMKEFKTIPYNRLLLLNQKNC